MGLGWVERVGSVAGEGHPGEVEKIAREPHDSQLMTSRAAMTAPAVKNAMIRTRAKGAQ